MTVYELIEKLQALPPDAEVRTWDPHYDIETKEVYVSTNEVENIVWVMNTTIGYREV